MERIFAWLKLSLGKGKPFFSRAIVPMIVTTIIQVLWMVSAVGLTALVLLHSPKGDGLGGLGGQAQLFTSTKSAETTLNRVTWALTALFMGLTVILSAGWLEVPAAAL
jgi:preprotein translocase subunit SecG